MLALLIEAGLVCATVAGFLLSERTTRDLLVVAGAGAAWSVAVGAAASRQLPMRPWSLSLHAVVVVATFAAARHFFADDSGRSAIAVLVALVLCVVFAALLVAVGRSGDTA